MARLVSSAFILFIGFSISFKEKPHARVLKNVPKEINTVDFADSALSRFRSKADSLRKGLRSKLRVVHIGDSHIQADYFTGEIRSQLQKEFGNGGRGLIFPYALAKTNGPGNYFTSSFNGWQASRNAVYPHKFPLGICGMSLAHSDNGRLSLNLLRDTGLRDVKDVLFFYSKSKQTDVFMNGKLRKKGSERMFACDTLLSHFTTPNSPDMEWKGPGDFYFHGAYLENNQAGLIYNMIGVNGACYKDYLATDYFFEQMPFLEPDLFIISLGTNESYNADFNGEVFEAEVQLFISKLRKCCPAADILLTGVSENYFRTKKKVIENKKVPLVNSILKESATHNKLAFWDLYAVMGGRGSMKEWKKKNLAAADYVHFNHKGYSLQGSLFSTALLKALE